MLVLLAHAFDKSFTFFIAHPKRHLYSHNIITIMEEDAYRMIFVSGSWCAMTHCTEQKRNAAMLKGAVLHPLPSHTRISLYAVFVLMLLQVAAIVVACCVCFLLFLGTSGCIFLSQLAGCTTRVIFGMFAYISRSLVATWYPNIQKFG